jgi:hypothetical protein
MPAKINMIISNGNVMPPQMRSPMNTANFATTPISAPKTSTALNSSIISRIHNVKPGCGSCGRH